VLRTVAGVQRAHPRLTVAEFGEASAAHELNDTIGKDFSSAERLSVPITFAILLIAFGAFVAAGVPVLLAFSGVLGSIGLSALLSHVFHASDSTSSVILLMGMAVGVDYSLFYLEREREERARGAAPETALARAAASSGQAVLISGGTVLIAMAGMLFAGSKIFTSIGIGAMIVVTVLATGALAASSAAAAAQATEVPAAVGRVPHSVAARQGPSRRVADLGLGAAPRPALSRAGSAGLGRGARRAWSACPGHAHQALGL
jgi:putative drug exporter of the RND superfamily